MPVKTMLTENRRSAAAAVPAETSAGRPKKAASCPAQITSPAIGTARTELRSITTPSSSDTST